MNLKVSLGWTTSRGLTEEAAERRGAVEQEGKYQRLF